MLNTLLKYLNTNAQLAGFCLFLLLLPCIASAQNVNLTPEQLSQLQSLSPAQQAALAQPNQQLVSGSASTDQQLAQPTTNVPRPESATNQQTGIEENAQIAQGTESLTETVEEQVVPDTLRQFGYELFASTPTTFAPATNIPVPLNYVIGPNDTVIFQLYGQRNARYEVVVTREGILEFPEIGPLNVAGLTFAEMRELIETTVQTSLIGQQVSVTMGALRSIQIFVLGEAFQPGSYTVSSLSTMTNALFSSGGVTNVGSLRNIRLMRQGQVVTELDLYDLLLRGDTSADVRLQPNDVIFIPPIGATVGIAGEVKRPAIFELKTEESIADVLPLAGGYLPTAYVSASRIERISPAGDRTIVDADLSDSVVLETQVRDGDILQIYSILDQVEGVVILEGHVNRPGGFAWREGLRVIDVLPSISNMLPNPDLDYALISREIQPTRTVQVININLRDVFSDPESSANLLLEPRDRLLVFGARQSRQQQVQGLIGLLRSQATYSQLPLVVNIEGNVLFPGEYPLLQGMTVDDLVKFAGGFNENSILDYALVERQVDLNGKIEVAPISFDDTSLQMHSAFPLEALDKVIVLDANTPRSELLANTLFKLRRQANTDEPTQIVSVIGNVRFPGEYPLHPDLTVGGLIEVAGGLLESAETRQAEITRYSSEPSVGREVIHEQVNLTDSSQRGLGLELQPFDQLVVRQMPNWTEVETVTINGEVNSPGVYVVTPEETLTSIISRAGGLTQYADPRSAVFLRESLREREERLIAEFTDQLEMDIVTLRLQQSVVQDNGLRDGGQSEAIQLLDRIKTLEPTGRLVIDLPRMMASPTEDNVILRDNDVLLIPRFQQEITVTGEVGRPTSHMFQEGMSYSDYIGMSGGFSDSADISSTYVIRSSGELVQLGRGRWFFQSEGRVEPGDTVIVPFKAYKPYGLLIWTNISQIVANFSTTLLLIDRITGSD